LKAAEQFTISQAALLNKTHAASEIDRILTDCVTFVSSSSTRERYQIQLIVRLQVRPVYLTLPTDLAYEKISSSRLASPISPRAPTNDPETQNFVLDQIVRLVEAAKNDVVILVDACAIRHGLRKELQELLDKTGYPVYCAPMGKTAIDETYERYGGVSVCRSRRSMRSEPMSDFVSQIYVGSISHPDIKERVESAKLTLSIGALKSDFNTGNFTYSIPTASTVEACAFIPMPTELTDEIPSASLRPHANPMGTVSWNRCKRVAPSSDGSSPSLP
jgi:pyruvate decarboxylase